MLSTLELEKANHNELYKKKADSWSSRTNNKEEYIRRYELENLTSFPKGGQHLGGKVRGLAIRKLLEAVKETGRSPSEITILDAGSGSGGLSVFLACNGFNVIGVEISEEGCEIAEQLANKMGVGSNCRFLPESLESMTIEDSSIDFVVGLHTLHHFIKYPNVPKELSRVMKATAKGFFADSFGENPVYHLFHDKEKMARLGDVSLTKTLIEDYLSPFHVTLTPTTWFSNIDKFLIRTFGWKNARYIRPISKVTYILDQLLPKRSRAMLFLSSTVMTSISKR